MKNRVYSLFTSNKQASRINVQCDEQCIEQKEKSNESRQVLGLFFLKGMAVKPFGIS